MGAGVAADVHAFAWVASSQQEREGRANACLGRTCAHIRRDLEAIAVFVALTRLCAAVAFTRLWPSAFMSDHVFLVARVPRLHGGCCIRMDF